MQDKHVLLTECQNGDWDYVSTLLKSDYNENHTNTILAQQNEVSFCALSIKGVRMEVVKYIDMELSIFCKKIIKEINSWTTARIRCHYWYRQGGVISRPPGIPF